MRDHFSAPRHDQTTNGGPSDIPRRSVLSRAAMTKTALRSFQGVCVAHLAVDLLTIYDRRAYHSAQLSIKKLFLDPLIRHWCIRPRCSRNFVRMTHPTPRGVREPPELQSGAEHLLVRVAEPFSRSCSFTASPSLSYCLSGLSCIYVM